ncbi:MAG: DNA polymerase III subunit delta [Acidobacteriota bacterium]
MAKSLNGAAGLRRALDGGAPPPLLLFLGEDRRELEDALNELENRLVEEDFRPMNSARLRGSETEVAELLNLCATLPLMAERRVVVVREPEQLKGDIDAFIEFLGEPPAETCLVLVPTKFDKRQRLSKAILDAATTVSFEAPGPQELEAWVARILGRDGLSLSPDAFALLADLVEANTLLLSHELEKLALYCHGREVVEREDVEALLGRSRSIEVWDLTNAIEDGRPDEAAAALQRLLDQQVAIPLLVGTLDWCLGRLLASEEPRARPGRRRSLERRRRALQGRAGEVTSLLREADRAVRTTGALPEHLLLKAVLAAAQPGPGG